MTLLTRHPLVLCATASLSVAVTASAADRWWDGTNSGGTGDGASAGGTATWDTGTLNWDRGAGLNRVAWDNGGYDTAIIGAASTLTLGGDIVLGNLTALSGTSTIRGDSTAGAEKLTFATGATPTGVTPMINNASTLTLGSFNATDIAGTEGLRKIGAGTLTISGTVAHSLTGGLTIDGVANAPTTTIGGRVEVDFSNQASNSSNMLNSSNALTISAGNFSVKGKSGGGILSQTMNGLTLSGGLAGLIVNHNSSTATTVDVGAITRANNSGLHVLTSNATAGLIKTSRDNTTSGILGTWATYQVGTGAISYASKDGSGNIVAYTGTAAADAAGLTDTAGAVNYDMAAATGTMNSAVSANTIRHTGAGGTTTVTDLTVNGLLNTGSAAWTLSGGKIYIGADKELVVSTAKSDMTIGSLIHNYGSVNGVGGEASGLTVTGYKLLTLTGLNTYTGATTLNGISGYGDGGTTVVVSALKNSGVASELGAGTNVVLNGAVIRTGATGTSDRDILINGTSGIYIKTAATQTLTGSISGTGNFSTDGDYNGGAPGGLANLILAGDNSFTGDFKFNTDSRVTLAHANALNNATLDMTGTRILADLTTHDLNYVIGGLKGSVGIDIGSGIVSIGNNNQSNEYSGVLSGAGSLNKVGSGTQVLTAAQNYDGATIVSGGTLALRGSGALPANSSIEVKPGAFLDASAVGGLTIAATQTLSGSGGVMGSVTVAGTLSPGSSPGTLTTGSQIWTTGADYNFQVHDAAGAAGNGYDTVAINGTLDLSGLADGGFAINLWSLSGLDPDADGNALGFDGSSSVSWLLASTTGGITGFEAGDFAINTAATNGTNGFLNSTNGGAFAVIQDGNNLRLNFTASVPEPSSLLLGGLGLLALARRRRTESIA